MDLDKGVVRRSEEDDDKEIETHGEQDEEEAMEDEDVLLPGRPAAHPEERVVEHQILEQGVLILVVAHGRKGLAQAAPTTSYLRAHRAEGGEVKRALGAPVAMGDLQQEPIKLLRRQVLAIGRIQFKEPSPGLRFEEVCAAKALAAHEQGRAAGVRNGREGAALALANLPAVADAAHRDPIRGSGARYRWVGPVVRSQA